MSPLNANDSIDHTLLGTEIDHFIGAGVNGIYSNGSAGEFYTQSEAEFDAVSALLAEKCSAADMPFQIGAHHVSPQLSLERMRRTKPPQPTAFQIILPDWFVQSRTEILAFVEKIAAEAAPIPLVLYYPPLAKHRLIPSDWREFVRLFLRLVGIKVPGGDDAWYWEMQPVR